MEMIYDQQNEMDFNDDSSSTISSISTKSDDTSSPCHKRKKIEKEIQQYATQREDTKTALNMMRNFQIPDKGHQIECLSNNLGYK
ncbi:hypothetical protein NPIL_483301 [Nephila pilipes]|uniref:Uncharacterized protein n=1 Tax=Nephila pilipes TaxID=299642 RepID=A0A8X6PKT7_NEPPI|nr:hypothetical protein NPIL_483301 [Nephila pilipes]